jgi:hypothetical protein
VVDHPFGVLGSNVVLHVVPRAAAEGAPLVLVNLSATGEALVTVDQLDWGSHWGREDHGRLGRGVSANVVTFTVLKECLMVKLCEGCVMSILSVTRCIIGKEGTVAMLAKENPECLMSVKANGVQDWGG